MPKKADRQTLMIAAVGLLATALRLALCAGVQVQFQSGSLYDDLMQLLKAVSISQGQWLGDYGPMTLVKGVGYPLLTALLHALHIPYVLGFHLLYVLACLAFAWAIRPLVQRPWLRLAAYLFVLFNPIAFSNAVVRFYRDIAYYAFCMLFAALLLGFLVRENGTLCAGLGGAALALCVLCREDCQWLYVYIAACFAAVLLRRSLSQKRLDTALWRPLLAAVAGLGLVLGCVCAVNYRYYGTFVLDEYNSGPYAAAYGAITRLDGGTQDPHVAIPYAERQKLYAASPAFAELQDYLDGEDSVYRLWVTEQGEYRTGYFSFALRDVVAAAGYYRDAASTNAYYRRLAAEANAYADSTGTAYPRHSGIMGRVYPAQIPAYFAAAARGALDTVRYSGVSCLPLPCTEDDAFLRTFEEYTGSTIAAQRDMPDGTRVENYHFSGFALWMQRGVRVLIAAYRLLTPALALAALAVFAVQSVRLLRRGSGYPAWIAALSLLLLFLLRELMLGFVEVTAFSAVGTPNYQAPSYAVMGMFIALQSALAAQDLAAGRSPRRGPDASCQ